MKTTPGYSGTPLAKKLGIRGGTHILVKHAPSGYVTWLSPIPEGVIFESRLSELTDLVHAFVDRKSILAKELVSVRKSLRTDAAVWISWPKKTSRVATDITEGTIREVALPLGFVDVKVCAVSDVWSGLKLVVRKELR